MKSSWNSTELITIRPTVIFTCMEIWIWQQNLILLIGIIFLRLTVCMWIRRSVNSQPFDKMHDLVMEYPVAESESEENNSYLAYSVVTGTAMDTLKCTAFDILDYALLSTPGAPLKKALLDAGIGSDVYGSYEDGIRQTYFDVVAKGADPGRKEEFVSIIRKVLTDTVENGIDPKALEAGINYMEFRYREADFSSYPKGLIYGLDILDNWLYDDEHPFAQVQLIPVFDKLKELKNQGYLKI